MMKELETVALLKNIPGKGLFRGDVGVVVSVLSDDVVEVEFTDNAGKTRILTPLNTKDLIRLRLESVKA